MVVMMPVSFGVIPVANLSQKHKDQDNIMCSWMEARQPPLTYGLRLARLIVG